MKGLKNKRILVAGAATGMGRATAERLAEEGARVYLGDINFDGVALVADRISASYGRFDLSDHDSVIKLVADAREQLGGLDGLANVAADLSPATYEQDLNLLSTTLETWRKTIDANLLGFAVLCREAIPALIDAGGGAIVNVSSDSAAQAMDTKVAYQVSKAGIEALTRHVATSWGKSNIRCNAVAPGYTSSESREGQIPDHFLTEMLAIHKLPRLGEPEDLAGTICHLLSDDASWVTGQVWSVNGGVLSRR